MIPLLRRLSSDTHFRNSFYLMMATGVMAVFGFLFWLIASRLATTANVGIATTLISVMNLIAYLSLVGFDTVFIRFLPTLTDKNPTTNTGILVVAITAVTFGLGFVVLVDFISPVLSFIAEGAAAPILFIFFCVMTAVNILTDSIFMAHRAPQYTLMINAALGLARLLIVLALVRFGTVGIFLAVAISQCIGLTLSILALIWKFHYRPTLSIDKQVLHQTVEYSMANYAAGVLNLLPATILPIMIANNLGAEQAAFYGIAMMIGNLLYAIPLATTRSLFAEGAHDPKSLTHTVRKTFTILMALMIPAIAIVCVAGGYFLGIFGNEYSSEGFRFLQIIAVSGLAVATLSILETYFRIVGNPNRLILINAFLLLSIWGGGYLLLPYGLVGIGIAWFGGHVIASIVSYVLLATRERASA